MIVITLLFGVFYLVDLQRPMSRYEPYDPRFAGKFKFALFFRNRLVLCICGQIVPCTSPELVQKFEIK